MKKRLFGWILFVAAVIMMAGIGLGTKDVAKADGDEPAVHANHCICGGNCESATVANGHTCMETAPVWLPWTNESAPSHDTTAPQYYYLAEDITLSERYAFLQNEELHLCLNGHTITATENRVFYIFHSPATDDWSCVFTIADCTSEGLGAITGGTATTFNAQAGNLLICNHSNLTMFGGNITNGKATTYAGNISVSASSEFTMYGGTISGGEAAQYAGNLYVAADATFNMYGGVVSRGLAKGHDSNSDAPNVKGGGGNIFVQGTANLYSGRIEFGDARDEAGGSTTGYSGGNLYVESQGKIEIYEGVTVIGGIARMSGGNLRMVKGTVNIKGGTLNGTGCKVDSYGANIDISGGTLTMTGGSISNGVAKQNDSATGGNIKLRGGTVNLNDGTVSDGVATKYGGNIDIDGGKLVLNGATISGGNNLSANNGGSVHQNSGTFQMKKGKIDGGCSCNNAGNLAAQGGTFEMTGGTIQNGKAKCTVADGSISGGESDNASANVFFHSNSATYNLYGGTIKGRALLYGGTMTLGGTIKIVNGCYGLSTNVNITSVTTQIVQISTEHPFQEGANVQMRDFTRTGNNVQIANLDTTLLATNAQESDLQYFHSTNHRVFSYDETIHAIRYETSNSTHCICGATWNGKEDYEGNTHTCPKSTTWTRWTSSSTLPTESGYYCLATDVACSSYQIPKSNSNIYICLNGHKVTGSSSRVYSSYNGSSHNTNISLTICDCQKYCGEVQTTRETNNNQGSIIWIGGRNSKLVIYNGDFSPVNANFRCQKSGGLFDITGASDARNTFVMYGGKIHGGYSTCNPATPENRLGGNVYMRSYTNLYMLGGEIADGIVEAPANKVGAGGNLAIGSNAIAYISGGKISNGSVIEGQSKSGGNIYIDQNGRLVLSGGEILEGNAANGGNITVGGGAELAISGGIIKDGQASSAGGNIFVNTENAVEMSGVIVSGGTNGSVVTKKDASNLTVSDGWYDCSFNAIAGSISISGGYFVESPSTDYIADGCETFTEENSYQEKAYHYAVGEPVFITATTKVREGDEAYVANVSTSAPKIRKGASAIVSADEPANSRYTFLGWYVGDVNKSEQKQATISNVNDDTMFVALYEYGGEEVDFSLNITSGSAFQISTDGGANYTDATSPYSVANVKAGSQYTVKFTGTEPFIAWQNSIGKFMSQTAEYTFTVGSNVTLEALYTQTSGKKIAFVSSHNQILKLVDWVNGTTTLDVAPAIPERVGKTSDGKWYFSDGTEATDDTINANEEKYITLTAKYTVQDEQYTVTLMKATVEGTTWTVDETALGTYERNKANTVNLAVTDTTNFIGFKLSEEGEFLSFNPTFTYHGTADVTIYAVYSTAEVAKKPVITMTNAAQLGTNGATFDVTRSVPDDYTMIEQGILLTTSQKVAGFEAAEAALTIDNGDVIKSVSSGTEKNGVTTLNVSKIGTLTVYARGYMIYSINGVNAIIYTEIAHGTAAGGFTIGAPAATE